MSSPDLEFEWDDQKARLNLKKHGVGFEEAEMVFDDLSARIIDDPDHSLDESREIIIGYSDRRRLLFVSYMARGNRIRIIGARLATREERRAYEQNYD